MKAVEQLSFITVGEFANKKIIGIMGNCDNNITTMYVFNDIRPKELQKEFLEIGKEWWESDQNTLPINIVMGAKFFKFKHCIKTYSTKEFVVIAGPTISLSNFIDTKIKKKQIRLSRKN